MPSQTPSEPPPTATPSSTAQPTPSSTAQPTPSPTAQPTPSPTSTATLSGGIYGRVTYQGVAMPDVELLLRFHDGVAWSTAGNTRTDAQGRYAFTGAPSLGVGQTYYIRYDNFSDDRFLTEYLGPDILTHVAGTSTHGGDFDIANVWLLAPSGQASVALPVTFSWQRRGVAGDTYRVHLIDLQSDQAWWSEDLGDTDHGSFAALPPGASYGAEYFWDVFVYDRAGGHGSSYYFRRITFVSTAAQGEGMRSGRAAGSAVMELGKPCDAGTGHCRYPVESGAGAAQRR